MYDVASHYLHRIYLSELFIESSKVGVGRGAMDISAVSFDNNSVVFTV